MNTICRFQKAGSDSSEIAMVCQMRFQITQFLGEKIRHFLALLSHKVKYIFLDRVQHDCFPRQTCLVSAAKREGQEPIRRNDRPHPPQQQYRIPALSFVYSNVNNADTRLRQILIDNVFQVSESKLTSGRVTSGGYLTATAICADRQSDLYYDMSLKGVSQ